MASQKKPKQGFVTDLDKVIAPLVAGVLLDLIQDGAGPISNKELVERTQSRHPDVEELKGQTPIGMNHRLLVISKVTRDLGFPNITSLALNQGTREVGSGYPGHDPQKDRERVEEFSWTVEERQKIMSAIEALAVGSPLT